MSFTLTSYRGLHQGGTKEYSLYQFTSAKTKRSVIVKRWGKTGADGQLKVETFKSTADAAMDKLLSERNSRGYDMRVSKGGNFDTVQQMLDAVLSKTHQRQLRNSDIAKLEPSHIDNTALYDPLASARAAMVEEFVDQVQVDKAAQAAAEREAEEAELKSNPLYGMF